VSTSPSRYVTAFGEAGIPTLGLEGGVGCNLRVTFDGKVRNLGPYDLQFDSPLPEDHRANIRSTPDSLRRHWKLGGAPPRSPAPMSTEGRSGVGGSSLGRPRLPTIRRLSCRGGGGGGGRIFKANAVNGVEGEMDEDAGDTADRGSTSWTGDVTLLRSWVQSLRESMCAV
jgi:hypothetical protein